MQMKPITVALQQSKDYQIMTATFFFTEFSVEMHHNEISERFYN